MCVARKTRSNLLSCGNSVCKVESPVTTKNELCDCFKIPKKHIMSTDFVILYGCSLFDFRKTKN